MSPSTYDKSYQQKRTNSQREEINHLFLSGVNYRRHNGRSSFQCLNLGCFDLVCFDLGCFDLDLGFFGIDLNMFC